MYSDFDCDFRDEVEIIYSALQKDSCKQASLRKVRYRSLKDVQNTKRSFQKWKAESKEKNWYQSREYSAAWENDI